ncbi:hypothetical protein EVAR_84293_1 [Eumeta japonica]|uniref:Uncharacterized protein n=1 Tax=Eumeta variegata TaxID=151549 RepID=A0A4C1WUJ2_EUMVA|nr:hypothetical protein EVAR_84293_1 [Eumeta japonica]
MKNDHASPLRYAARAYCPAHDCTSPEGAEAHLSVVLPPYALIDVTVCIYLRTCLGVRDGFVVKEQIRRSAAGCVLHITASKRFGGPLPLHQILFSYLRRRKFTGDSSTATRVHGRRRPPTLIARKLIFPLKCYKKFVPFINISNTLNTVHRSRYGSGSRLRNTRQADQTPRKIFSDRFIYLILLTRRDIKAMLSDESRPRRPRPPAAHGDRRARYKSIDVGPHLLSPTNFSIDHFIRITCDDYITAAQSASDPSSRSCQDSEPTPPTQFNTSDSLTIISVFSVKN